MEETTQDLCNQLNALLQAGERLAEQNRADRSKRTAAQLNSAWELRFDKDLNSMAALPLTTPFFPHYLKPGTLLQQQQSEDSRSCGSGRSRSNSKKSVKRKATPSPLPVNVVQSFQTRYSNNPSQSQSYQSRSRVRSTDPSQTFSAMEKELAKLKEQKAAMEVRIKALEKDNEQLKSLTTDTRVTVLETQLKNEQARMAAFMAESKQLRLKLEIKESILQMQEQQLLNIDPSSKQDPQREKFLRLLNAWREKTFQLMMQAALAKKTEKLKEQRYQTWVKEYETALNEGQKKLFIAENDMKNLEAEKDFLVQNFMSSQKMTENYQKSFKDFKSQLAAKDVLIAKLVEAFHSQTEMLNKKLNDFEIDVSCLTAKSNKKLFNLSQLVAHASRRIDSRQREHRRTEEENHQLRNNLQNTKEELNMISKQYKNICEAKILAKEKEKGLSESKEVLSAFQQSHDPSKSKVESKFKQDMLEEHEMVHHRNSIADAIFHAATMPATSVDQAAMTTSLSDDEFESAILTKETIMAEMDETHALSLLKSQTPLDRLRRLSKSLHRDGLEPSVSVHLVDKEPILDRLKRLRQLSLSLLNE